MNEETLLIIEDDPGITLQLRRSFEQYRVFVAENRESALNQLKRHQPGVITLDLGLPPHSHDVSEGFATLKAILTEAPASKIIVLTGNEERSHAVQAIGMGAYDYYQKPIDAEVLGFVIARAFRLLALEQENRRLHRTPIARPLENVIAISPAMHDVCRVLERLAPTDLTVLLVGESGTGKEVLAKTLHRLSPRAHKPFVAVNSAAIPETLLESELFGFEKGAYTGATQQTRGKFELADGGTFFLDEIGDLPFSLQPKLLRVLQERTVERVGGRQAIPVDVRLICATHQNLVQQMDDGRFRPDLYYRINEMTIEIPPLRQRDGDVLLLAHWFLERFAKVLKRPDLTGFSEAALLALEAHPWPGNVRELEHKVKRAIVMARGPMIEPVDLDIAAQALRSRCHTLREVRDAAEREAIARALAETGQNMTRAAEILDITRPTLYALLDKFNLKV
ncbi:MAG: PEP-CTERM-box response regulator transcription factor [Methylococcaceae bacterium]